MEQKLQRERREEELDSHQKKEIAAQKLLPGLFFVVVVHSGQ